MQRITIVGLDNIGASMGLALKRWIGEAQKADPNGALEVVGFDYDVARQRAAERVHAVDRTQWSLSKAVQDASLVVLALPANETREAMRELGALLSDDAIVTDTAPHKQQCLRWAAELLPRVQFVGGFPIVPTAPEAPTADAFAGATYALFPQPDGDQESAQVVVGLVQALGAEPFFPDPAEHDALYAAAGILPALAATAMMHTVAFGGGWRDMAKMGGGDLAAATALVGLDPARLVHDVGLSPAEAERWLDGYIFRLTELRDLVRRRDPEATEQVQRFIQDAHIVREEWLHPQRSQTEKPERFVVTDHLTRLLLGSRRRRGR